MQRNSLDIAIVGVGAIMPIGLSREQYWKAILEGVDGITDVPDSLWQKTLYYSEDRRKSDTTYSSIGALVKGFSFDRKRFRVPPKTVEAMDPTQQMAVSASVEALEDAGVDLETVDGSRVAVILGNALGGDIRHSTTLRIRLAEVLAKLESDEGLSGLGSDVRGDIIRRLEGLLKASLPPVTEDTMPGELSNCIAGRVCNLLDLRGQSYTVDAACASSLAALSAACHALRAEECDLALTGGVDNSMGPETYVKFAKIGALSATGSRPFDAGADGFVLGEGCGVLALRRLEDVSAKDHIYAVIRSIGSSSDGRGKGITAPNPKGQHLAIDRAYEAAGFELSTVDYIEAHGTSTTIGDAIECRVLSEVLEGATSRSEPVRLSSVKSQIGHLKSAAGVAGMIKAAMALKHKVYPPSINFEQPNEALSTARSLAVQTRVEPWKRLNGHPRRAAVSSFGFGGTNFHVVLEEARRDEDSRRPKAAPKSIRVEASGGGGADSIQVVALGAADVARLVAATRELSNALDVESADGEISLAELIESRGLHRDVSGEACRLAIATSSISELKDQLKRSVTAIKKNSGSGLRLLANRGCFARLSPHDRGALGMLFPGQGSQYVGMLDELRRRYDVVTRTLAEADAVMEPILGRPLTDFIFGKGFSGGGESSSRSKSAEAALLQTTITQPAVLACDVALLRVLADHGIRPDVVAGHSLGEYAACVAAGVLEFGEALQIVAARGHHMTAATPEGGDPGWMAAVGASVEHVEKVLERVTGYVVPANKNCKTQTIIAGASESVQHAMALFAAEGVQTTRIPVSHAFHTRVVSSASGPLRRVLEETGLGEPNVPILSNVTGDLYPTGGGAREAIIDLLSRQVASPVEFISQIERMHDLGVRTFLEVGPKKALASFVESILEELPHQSYITNHPKRGELRSFHEALAALIADGYPLWIDGETRAGTVADPAPAPDLESRHSSQSERRRAEQETARESVTDVLIRILCEKTGYDAEEIELDFELEADLGVDTVKQAEVLAAVREHFGLDRDEAFRLADYPSVEALIEYVETRAGTVADPDPDPAPALEFRHSSQSERLRTASESAVESGAVAKEEEEAPDLSPLETRAYEGPYAPPSGPDAIVVSGVSAGLPGLDDPFASDGFDQLLDGRTLISEVGGKMEEALSTKGIVRVVKHGAGEPEFIEVCEPEQALHLAGRGHDPKLSSRYGIPAELHEDFDTTTKWSLAAAVEVLRDAGLPLVRTEHVTRSGRRLSRGFRLPEAVGRRTGIIFASAFPGYNRLLDEIERQERRRAGDGGEPFSRSFLVQALAFAHAHIAQYIGALGPNVQMNAACASTTISLITATDWIRAGRCDRVIVVGADDVTSDMMFPYIGAGFLALGAATTERDVSKAALPFDRRRNGMILGMGAVALVIERAIDASERGVTPIAEVMATRLANSAFSPVRIRPEHVAEEVRTLVDDVEREHGLDRRELSRSCVFMSHEPYTPARGGSAQAEIEALRAAFGDDAKEVTIANTKGFTGHAMGAGLEEFVALRSLERQVVPPVPNLLEPDPEMSDLKISNGGHVAHEYSMRLAAGFGSQVAVTLLRRTCPGPDRIDKEALTRWASQQVTTGPVRIVVDHRHLQATPDVDQPKPTPQEQPRSEGELDLGDLGQGIRAWQVVTDAVDRLDVEDRKLAFESKPVVVLGGGAAAADPVIAGLEALGAVVIHIEGVDLSIEPVALERALEVRIHEGGRPLGLINLLPFEETEEGEAEEVHRRLKTLFHTVRAMGIPERFVVTLTGLGGGCGVETLRRSIAASAGAHAGFTKALAREWAEQVAVKVVDIDVDVLAREKWASAALREGLTDDGLVEVGYGHDGRRTTALRETVTVGVGGFEPSRESVVVFTGGAGGITAAVGLELVARGVGRVALLDLAPLLSDDPEAIDVALERRRIKGELKERGERVTPAKIEAELIPFRAGRQVAETIDAFRRAGAEVFYRQCDLADGGQVGAAIAAVREQFGRIDGVVHGAGLEVSQALEDKSPDIFDRVFCGKALGAIHLWQALADELPSFFVAFSSVAGRFGNMGQQDYAAANEVLARLGASAPSKVQALTVDWTAWDQIGMAANASMRALLTSRGVDLLPPMVGTKALADLLLAGVRGEVVICGRLGELASPRFVARGRHDERHGWLDRIIDRSEKRIVAEVDLDPTRHRYLEDHEIAGVKVLPGVVGLELMVSTARQLLGEGVFVEARDVRFERPVKVHDGHPVTLRVEASISGDGRAEVTLGSQRLAASGRTLEAEHFRATINLGAPTDTRPLDRLCFDTPEDVGPDAAVIYGPDGFFHGPGFRVLEVATRVAEEHLVARVKLPDAGELILTDGTPTTHVSPLSWEAVLQAAGLWIMGHSRAMALPHGMERAQRFGPLPESGEVIVRVAALPLAEGQDRAIRRFDVEVHDEDGLLLQRALGVTLIETGERAGGAALDGFSNTSAEGFVERRDLDLEGLHDIEEFDRLAKCYLSEPERQRVEGFRSDKRRREWLGGRVAAKHLIKEHLRDRYGIAVEVRKLEVVADSKGAPRPRLIDRPEVKHAMPNIAITHCRDHAIVGLVPAFAKARVGVDLERIELRSPSFERQVLTDGEHESLTAFGRGARDERVTLFWALKEATSKALGLGLTIDPREMEVISSRSDGSATIHLFGRARERYEELGGRGLEARTKVEGHDAFAIVVLRLDGSEASRSTTVGDAAVLANHLQPQCLETWRIVC